jgi:hypothetical protein
MGSQLPASLKGLVEPSLGGAPVERPYSVRSCLLVAFFGGPFAVSLFGLLISQRLGKLTRDVGWLALVSLTWAVAVLHDSAARFAQVPFEWTNALEDPARTLPYTSKFVALTAAGVFYLLNKNTWRAAELTGDPPSPWVPALMSLGLSGLVSVALSLLAGIAVAALG